VDETASGDYLGEAVDAPDPGKPGLTPGLPEPAGA
jgi:hypothetical protein